MPASAKFWSRRKKVAFETCNRGKGPSYFHGKTISAFAKSTIKGPKARQDDALTRNPKFRMAEPTMIRGIRIGGAALIAASLISVITPCSAQTTQAIPPQIIPPQTIPPQTAQKPPAPKPAPKVHDKQLSASDPQKDWAAAKSQSPNPVIPDPRRNVPANIFATFDANQKA